MTEDPFDSMILKVREHYDADIISYIGGIYAPADNWISKWLSEYTPKMKNILGMLRTNGGIPDVAYRIARQFQVHYNTIERNPVQEKRNFYIYVGKECKSAGTLMTIGADILIMSENAELGPLDVQLRKQDEVGERTSGLAPIQALGSLREQAIEHFKSIFWSLRFDNELAFSTKMAAEIATKVTVGLLNSIYAQIDPVRMSEIERQLNIASAYGERLEKAGNLQKGTLSRLLAEYPSHGFVIDKSEAKELFNKVESPISELSQVFEMFCSFTEDNFAGKSDPSVIHVRTSMERNQGQKEQVNVKTTAA